MAEPVRVTVHNDPGCPWGYSATPALRVLEWRYGSQLDWRLVLIGLTEQAAEYVERGYTPLSMSTGYVEFRRFGMPFSTTPRERVVATGRACRAVVASRVLEPGSEWRAFRALQLAWFTSTLLLDEDDAIHEVLRQADGIDADAVVSLLDDPRVEEAYGADHTEARTAAGSPTELQGKAAESNGVVRYTAPSVIVEADGRRLEAGGFQPVQAYDVVIVNADPTLGRADPPDDPAPLLARFEDGLTTQEVAALLTRGNDEPDPQAAELALLELVAGGRTRRSPLGDSALWTAV